MKLFKLPELTAQHKELLSYISDNRGRLALAILCSSIVAAMTSVSAWLVKPVVEGIFQST